MINFIKAIARSIFIKTLNAGDIFIIDDYNRNPFADPPHKVVVKDVKNGWVNYRFIDSTLFQNESMRVSSFMFCYKKLNSRNEVKI